MLSWELFQNAALCEYNGKVEIPGVCDFAAVKEKKSTIIRSLRILKDSSYKNTDSLLLDCEFFDKTFCNLRKNINCNPGLSSKYSEQTNTPDFYFSKI